MEKKFPLQGSEREELLHIVKERQMWRTEHGKADEDDNWDLLEYSSRMVVVQENKIREMYGVISIDAMITEMLCEHTDDK